MFQRAKLLVAAAFTGLLFSTTTAGAITIGNAPIERGSYDSYSNFGIALTDVISPVSGTLNSFSVFSTVGDFALLVLRAAGAGSFTLEDYTAASAVSAGLNTFAANMAIQSGDVLGLYMGTGKISYQLNSTPNVCAGLTCDAMFTSNGGIADLGSLVGTEIAFNEGSTDRTYSVEAAIVPLPAGLPLLASGLIGFVMLRRRKKLSA